MALYISKKDALADAVFERYAARSAADLRQSPEFYDHLREMPSPLHPKSGFVDRTILLKLNMQLSMETMQSSLRATWKLLTEERKNLLINSSMKARPAEERMLRTIASPLNPGRCSCGQVAPPEYNADRDCCARGTELVFTWRKNGDLEVCGGCVLMGIGTTWRYKLICISLFLIAADSSGWKDRRHFSSTRCR